MLQKKVDINSIPTDTMTTTKNNNLEEYVFRFPIAPCKFKSSGTEMLEEYFTDQIRDLLKIVSLYHNGKKILPDEFSFLNKPDHRVGIWNKE